MPLAIFKVGVEWVSQNPWLVWGSIALSAATFAAALILLPIVVVRLPADYFSHNRPPELHWQKMHPGLRFVAHMAKNLLGVGLLAVGFVMLFIPGQGVLSMLLGLALLDLPGKRKLERWIVSRPAVYKSLNRLRKKYGKPPLERPR